MVENNPTIDSFEQGKKDKHPRGGSPPIGMSESDSELRSRISGSKDRAAAESASLSEDAASPRMIIRVFIKSLRGD